MSGRRDSQAEVRKLAHTLGVEPGRLDMVASLPADDLRTLRAQVGEALFQADKHYFARLATLSRSVPGAVSAKMTELALPPLLAARTSELLETAKAIELIGRLSDPYLADVSAAVDPTRSPQTIAAIPPARTVTISQELARRGEWVVIGAFASVISAEALEATVATYNGEQLLRIGFVLEDVDRLDTIGALLTDEQVDDMLAAAVAHELWDELGDQLEHITGPRITRISARFAAAPDNVTSALRAAAADGRFDAAALALLEP